ncbi:MAG TPA: TonB-dependent receptor, partial [Rhodocyclaceae bacterium]|nr:TonB-dependent receptor [Rhodocyclaceae bacterium]
SATTGLLKVGVNPGRDSRLELSHQFYDSDNLAPNNPLVGRYKKTTDTLSIPFLQPTHVNQYNTVLKAASGDADGIDGPRLEGSLYQSYLKVILDPYATNPAYANAATTNYALTKTRTDGASFQLTRTLGDHRLLAGVDMFKDMLDSRSGTAVNSVNPAGQRKGTGAFVQDEIKLAGQWKIVPTLRYDEYDASALNSTQAKNSENRLSPKATLSWGNDDRLMVYGSYGEGFRAPAVNELYESSRIGTFSWFLPNASLKPEIDKTVEAGAKSTLRNLLAEGDALKLRAAVFHSKVQDLISYINLGSIPKPPNPNTASCATTGLGCQYQYQNVQNARREGAELEAGYLRGLWQVDAAYGRVRVTNTDTGENLFSPPDKLSLQVRRRLPDQGLSVLWNSTIVAAQDYDSTVLRRRAGYPVHDLFATWTPSGQKYRVDAGITNLFDHGYVVYQSSNAYAYTYQEGRSVKVAVSVDF